MHFGKKSKVSSNSQGYFRRQKLVKYLQECVLDEIRDECGAKPLHSTL